MLVQLTINARKYNCPFSSPSIPPAILKVGHAQLGKSQLKLHHTKFEELKQCSKKDLCQVCYADSETIFAYHMISLQEKNTSSLTFQCCCRFENRVVTKTGMTGYDAIAITTIKVSKISLG